MAEYRNWLGRRFFYIAEGMDKNSEDLLPRATEFLSEDRHQFIFINGFYPQIDFNYLASCLRALGNSRFACSFNDFEKLSLIAGDYKFSNLIKELPNFQSETIMGSAGRTGRTISFLPNLNCYSYESSLMMLAKWLQERSEKGYGEPWIRLNTWLVAFRDLDQGQNGVMR